MSKTKRTKIEGEGGDRRFLRTFGSRRTTSTNDENTGWIELFIRTINQYTFVFRVNLFELVESTPQITISSFHRIGDYREGNKY